MGEENNAVNNGKNTTANQMNSEELAAKIYENSRRALTFQKFSAICMAGIFALLLITVIIVVPKAMSVLNATNDLVVKAQSTIDNADATLEDISSMAESLQQAGDKMDQILADNEAVLVESMDKISNIDFDGLNEGIHDLQEAVGPFASFMSRFK